MAGVASNRGRAMNFEGFLSNLQDLETSNVDRGRKPKSQADRGKRPINSGAGRMNTNNSPQKNVTLEGHRRMAGGSGTTTRMETYNYLSSFGSASPGLGEEESSPTAASEKELGNKYFKQNKFNEAIECYSKSIALSPTAVAFANRAMAYLKIKKYDEAEKDCTESLTFDDRYVKAYSRRATARKELGKLKESLEDSEFALRLEPNNQELQKLYNETKTLHGKLIIQQSMNTSRSSKDPVKGILVVEDPDSESKGADNQNILTSPSLSNEKSKVHSGNKEISGTGGKHMLKTSMQETATRASFLLMTSAAKNITIPTSAYEFEVSWKALSDNPSLQASLLKGISPENLPKLFRTSLSATLLIDIVKRIATFFKEDTDLAVNFLDNLTKVPRFNMIVMCLSALDRTDALQIWEDVFCGPNVPAEQMEKMIKLRSKFCPRALKLQVDTGP